jgi:hypothetical protein
VKYLLLAALLVALVLPGSASPLIPLLSAATLMLETIAVRRAGRFPAEEAARWCSIARLLQLRVGAAVECSASWDLRG